MIKKEIYKKLKNTENLVFFNNLKSDKLLKNLKKICSNQQSSENLSDLIYQLLRSSINAGVEGDIWHNYLKNIITDAENIFSLKSEKNEIAKNFSLYSLALRDINTLMELFSFTFKDLIEVLDHPSFNSSHYKKLETFKLSQAEINDNLTKNYQKLFTSNSSEENLRSLIDFYKTNGAGILNKSRAFYWENCCIKPVNNPDQIKFKNLIAYQKAKDKLLENTESFLNGYQAHNVLLYGDSGTGKSSSVKALLNKYYKNGLRLIEINSSQIKKLPEILEFLNQRGLNFIIFMDDLSFEEFETDYKYLKAVMEGGIESRPDNVLFYATSNRRHLVREKWQDRESEVHENDILNEKLSLAERFGLTIMFNNPSQAEYLTIVSELAEQENIELNKNELKERALKWSKWNNGRSGRSARQFIDQLLKEKRKKAESYNN